MKVENPWNRERDWKVSVQSTDISKRTTRGKVGV